MKKIFSEGRLIFFGVEIYLIRMKICKMVVGSWEWVVGGWGWVVGCWGWEIGEWRMFI
jgi:hypothetical protein